MEVDGESPGDRETEVKREVWDHLPATLESHKGGGGEGRGPLRVRRLAFCQGAPKVWVFLGIFSGADQTHEGIPGLHLTQELITVLTREAAVLETVSASSLPRRWPPLDMAPAQRGVAQLLHHGAATRSG